MKEDECNGDFSPVETTAPHVQTCSLCVPFEKHLLAMKGVRQDFPRARLGPDLRRHCWTKAVTGAVPPRSISPVDRWTNAAGIVTGLFPPMPTRASHLLLPGVGTVGHPPAGALLKMIAALAPASFATDTFVLKVHTPRSIS